MAPLDILLDICTCSLGLQSILSPESTGKLAQGGQQQLLVTEAQADVPPGRGTEQPSGSGDALDVLAEPQCSSVGAQSSDKVVPLALLGAAVLAPTSSTVSLTQPGLGADTTEV